MRRRVRVGINAVATLAVLLGPLPESLLAQVAQDTNPWMNSSAVNAAELTTTGKSRYFILEPGYQLTLADKGHKTLLVISVLAETKTVGGIETRVVEQRETENGVTVEVSRNYFAIHPETHDLFYFGEDVDTYKKGKIAGHEGAWQDGTASARFGLMVPGSPKVGMRYDHEQAPRIAQDRGEVVSVTDRITTPAGTFDHCLAVKETTPMEPLIHDYRTYAPDVGLVKYGPLVLVSHGFVPALQK